ncbi:MAG TPA: hypothetical protein VJ576_02885, partial [Rhodocyclaceae bacterium]|nr:hypothetical protein [Rhodocyclaceae bacterium]
DTHAIADADGLGTFAYQWLRNGVAIAGATGSTYTLGDADVGHAISVRISYTDGQGWDESLTSAPTGPVAAVNQGSGGETPIGGENPTTGNPPEKPTQNENPTGNPTAPHPTPGTPSQSAPASTSPPSGKPGLFPMDHLPLPAAPVQPPDQWETQAIAAPRVQSISMLSPQLTKVVFADASNRLSEIDIVGNAADGQYSVRMASLNRDDGIQSRPSRDLEVSITVADDATPETDARHEAVVRTGQALGITLTAGTVLWSLRVSGLLMGMLATIPAWRQLDLLSILPNPADSRSNWGRDDSDEASKDEDSIDDILAPPDDRSRP